MKIVIKIGGSISMEKGGPNSEYLLKLLKVIEEINKKHKISLCIGGGKFVKNYSKNIERFKLKNKEREECFIELMKANVKLLSLITNKKPIYSLEDYEGEEAVISGIKPGRSTDANAAKLAEIMNADLFIKLTDVDGIYNKDPNKNKNAKLLRKINYEELDKVKGEEKPLDYGILDPKAMKIIKENRIKTILVNGKNPKNLLKVMEGKKIGTTIE